MQRPALQGGQTGGPRGSSVKFLDLLLRLTPGEFDIGQALFLFLAGPRDAVRWILASFALGDGECTVLLLPSTGVDWAW